MQAQDGFDAFYGLPDSSSNGLTYPYTPSLTEAGRAFQHWVDAGRAASLQQYYNNFANTHPPMVPLFQQSCDSYHQNMDRHEMTLPPFNKAPNPFDNGSDLSYHNYPTAATVSVPRLDFGRQHSLTPLTSAFEASRITLPTPFASAPGSEISGHGYQDVYGPHSWNTGSFHQHQHQHQQSDTSATHETRFDGQPWTAHQEESPK